MASWCLVCPVDIVTVVDLAANVDHTKLKGRLGVVVVLHSIDEDIMIRSILLNVIILDGSWEVCITIISAECSA